MRKKEINYTIPQIKTWRTRYYNGGFGGVFRKGIEELQVPMSMSMEKTRSVQSDSFAMQESVTEMSEDINTDEIRSEFNDTAFFIPHIISQNGKFDINIKLPDQLTKWKLIIAGNTKEMKTSNIKKSIIAQKRLSIRADFPRFLRENDNTVIQAMISNNTQETLNANLNIKIMSENIDITKNILVRPVLRNISLNSNQSRFVDINLKPHTVMTDMKIQLAVRAGDLSDSEIVYLPVFPAYERLLVSDIKLLDGNTHTELRTTPMSQKYNVQQSVLSIEPNTVINLLSTIPYIISHSVYSTDSMAFRFVPLAILNRIFTENREIADMASKINPRDSILLPWEENDTRNTLNFDETPWKTRSEGYRLNNLIAMTDSDKVAQNTKYFLEKLIKAQNSDGGFPWMPGGRSNLYTTMNVLENLSQVIAYDIKLPEDTIKKALYYVRDEFNKKDRLSTDNMIYQCYAGFVLSEYYGAGYSGSEKFITYLKKWSENIEKRIPALSPMGKVMYSIMLTNIGRKAKGKELIDAVMDNSQKSEQGIFWTPEKYSWIWYNDSINTHCMVIRALNRIDSSDSRIKELVTWLLWNRKGNSWDTPDHSVKALYAILESMKKNSALLSQDLLNISWGEEKAAFEIDPLSTMNKILITKSEESVKNQDSLLKADIKKYGKGSVFASLTTLYIPQGKTYASSNPLINIKRDYYITKKNSEGKNILSRIKESDITDITSDIEVELTIETTSQLEFVYINDPKPSGFENKDLLSSWQFQPLWFYREIRDSSTRFFFDWLPHGSLKVRYTLYPTKQGRLNAPPARIQSVYSPDINAHTDSFMFNIKGE
jgi:uncharacterized protein YfaS (alpha-2-macroglobulin family)